MPAAWIGAGAAAIGAIGSLTGGSSGGGASQVAQGVGNVVGGGLSASEAIGFGGEVAQTANPFGQYNQQFGAMLAGQSGINQNFGNSTYGSANLGGLSDVGINLGNSLNGQGYAQQINNLVANPSSVFQTPQYQAAFGQGQNAVNATLAAQGLNASGNQLAALQSYGQTFGQNAYNTQLSQLSGLYGQALSGNQQGYAQAQNAQMSNQASNQQAFNQLAQLSGLATGSPTAAAAAQSQIFGNVNSAGQAVGQGVGQIATGAGNLLNGLNFGSGSTGFSTGLGTTTSGFGDVSGSGGLFGTSAGLGGDGFTMGGNGNTFGFTE